MPPLKPLFIKSFQNWEKDNAPQHAAALAFYAMLALSPLLVLAVAIASRILGDSEAGAHIVKVAEGYLGTQGANLLKTLIEGSAKPGASAIASLLSLLVALYGAINLFQELSDSIDFIWKVKSAHVGLSRFLRGKLLALLIFLVFAALLLVWLLIDSWVGWIEAHTPGFNGRQFLSFLVSVVFLTFVFGLTFRALPKRMVAWSDVWIGAVFTAIGFGVSKYLLSLYFSYSTTSAAYGSTGALVIVLLWTYYSAQIFFFGIELTCTYAHMHGSQIERHIGDPPIPVPTNT